MEKEKPGKNSQVVNEPQERCGWVQNWISA